MRVLSERSEPKDPSSQASILSSLLRPFSAKSDELNHIESHSCIKTRGVRGQKQIFCDRRSNRAHRFAALRYVLTSLSHYFGPSRLSLPHYLFASLRRSLPALSQPGPPAYTQPHPTDPVRTEPVTTPAKPVAAAPTRSEEIVQKHKKYLWPSVTNYYQQPLVADRGEMQYLWDLEGRKYLDFFGGILTVSVGHCNPKVTNKINAQINRLQHTSTLYPNEHIVALAEKIASITPGNLQQSFFTNSGTEANEAAILIARMATGSYDVVALRHAYSGSSQLAKAVTAHAPYRKAGVISIGISHAMNPYCYRCPLHLKYPDCEVACAGDVENLIQTGTSGSIAAFIAEPIQGVGGFITPPKEYFKIVFKIVKKYGGLFVSDEVQTGWGRTGKKWFGIEQWEVTPDILTSAKGLGNGVPIGLTVTTPEIAASYQGLNISTFGGNPVTSVAAKATIDFIEEENLLENAHTVGTYFRGKLEELQTKYPLIGDVRGMGLMQALELVKDRKTKEPAPEATTQVMERARDNGLLIGKGGLYGNVLRIAPMLNISKPDVDEGVRLLDKSFSEVRI
jgi:4-aminobutyrate aminotransferase-like enzyme